MLLLQILLLLLCNCLNSGEGAPEQHRAAASAPPDALVAAAIVEIESSLDAYFQLIDEKKLDHFLSGVRHAARGRLLLEQYLGADTDNYSFELARRDEFRHGLIMIASHAKKFTGEEARDMWLQDPSHDYYSIAKQRLVELDVMVKGLKAHYLRP